MIIKLIRNMSTPSRIPLRSHLINNKYDINIEHKLSSYSYMYQALGKYNSSYVFKNKSKSNSIVNRITCSNTKIHK